MFQPLIKFASCFICYLKKGKAYEHEHEQPDDYPIFDGYLYIVNGKIWRSPFTGTVRKAKDHFLNRGTCIHSFKNCDVIARRINDKEF